MLAIIMTGMADSMFGDMINLAARMGGGHVTLQHPEYLDRPTLKRTLADTTGLREIALREREVERVVPRITGQLLLSTAAQSYGAAFIAFDPTLEDNATLSILDSLVEGEVFASPDDKGIILGSRLAGNLGARLGRKVVYTLADKHGEITREAARVTGILRTGSPSVDAALALLPIDTFRRAVAYSADEGIQVAVFLSDQRRANAVATRLADRVGTHVSALTWRQAQPDVSSFITMKDRWHAGDGGTRDAAGSGGHLQHTLRERDGNACASSGSCWRSASARRTCSGSSCSRACGSGS